MIATLHRTVILLFLIAGSLAANPILEWNEQVLSATRLSRNPPPLAGLHYGTYHIAIFDAVNGITRTHHGWLVNDPAPAGADMDAAIAGAAYTVLREYWSNVTNPRVLKRAYDEALASIADGPAKETGLAWGRDVAQRVIAARANSGWDKPVAGEYNSQEPGKWRETPPGFRPPVLPYWGRVVPFAMKSQDQFRAPPPNSPESKIYAEEAAFVASVGARDGAERTEYQTLSTPFWSDDLGTSTPPGHWNSIAQDIARRHNLSTEECARLFALLNIASADAGIACWETKFYYSTWRPETALRETTPDYNPHIKLQPDFIPNMASPAFPAYTSGHSTFSAAGSRIIERFMDTDDVTFTVTSDGLPGVVREFTTISEARWEVGMSRIWGGIHVMQDNLVAQKVGMDLADYVFENFLRPLK